MARPEITILVRGDRGFERHNRYLINQLWSRWETRGHQVRLARGVGEKIPGDIVFMHVDSTVVPEEYLEYASQFPVAINGKVRDVSKDVYSTLSVNQNDKWDGRVIVKTKANYGGHTDLAPPDPETGFHVSTGESERPWRKRRTLDPYDYPVFDSLAQVPAGVWRNPHLIVEKFMAEFDENGHYVTRSVYFLADSEFVRVVSSPYQIVKELTHGDDSGRECYTSKTDDPVPKEIHQMKERLGFDYGRFDYVEVAGRGILLDANPTPAISEGRVQMFAQEIDDLTRAIETFV